MAMKRAWRVGLAVVTVLILALAGCQAWQSRQSGVPEQRQAALRVATHNVHYIVLGRDDGRWSRGDWESRRHALDAAFKALDADMVAFQEMESFAGGSDGSVNLARDWLLARNPDYAAAAHGDWRRFPSTQPILYRTDRLGLRHQGWFFFSETPEVIYSATFDGSYPAFASWAEFVGSQGVFRVVNVHFDYRSWENRRRSAELVRDRVAPWIAEGLPVLLLGDLNALHGSPTMAILRETGLSFARVPGATMHFDRGLHLLGAIDHIGVSGGIAFEGGPWVQRRRFDGRWSSDHHPVAAGIALR